MHAHDASHVAALCVASAVAACLRLLLAAADVDVYRLCDPRGAVVVWRRVRFLCPRGVCFLCCAPSDVLCCDAAGVIHFGSSPACLEIAGGEFVVDTTPGSTLRLRLPPAAEAFITQVLSVCVCVKALQLRRAERPRLPFVWSWTDK